MSSDEVLVRRPAEIIGRSVAVESAASLPDEGESVPGERAT
jgi:hypothetical protein